MLTARGRIRGTTAKSGEPETRPEQPKPGRSAEQNLTTQRGVQSLRIAAQTAGVRKS